MNLLVIIVFVGIIGVSISGILSIIDDSQELSQINHTVSQKQNEITSELINIKAVSTISGGIEFSNTSNEKIKIIQIRVYDDSGEYVESFDVSEIILGNVQLEVTDLPISLQEMLRDE